uniref:Uncharacterized protein n=1 Tax=Kalanchoe fedtschenkoi TaxID=63787 RepID=A0A7N0SX29_KALFE
MGLRVASSIFSGSEETPPSFLSSIFITSSLRVCLFSSMAANMKLGWVAAVFVFFLVLQTQLSSARSLSSDFTTLPVDKQHVEAPNTKFAGEYAPLVFNKLPKTVRVPPSGPSKGTNKLKDSKEQPATPTGASAAPQIAVINSRRQ